MVRDTVAHLRAEGQRVFLDAEHFFDGYRSNPTTRSRCCGSRTRPVPTSPRSATPTAACCPTRSPTWCTTCEVDRPALGIHCHNDTGCAVANSLAAVDAGATHVQGTLNGYGERTGNADLLTWSPTSSSSSAARCCRRAGCGEATRVAHAVAEVANVPPASRQPYVGASAFAHKAGLHASAIKVDPMLYQHMDPEGRQRHAAAGLRHGRPRVDRAQGPRARLRPVRRRRAGHRVTDRVKDLEAAGYTFEAADASFELLLREEVEGARPSYFEVESWRVITETRPARRRSVEATVKLHAGASGSSRPARATARSTRSTTRCAGARQAYPEVAKLELIDYKVRILDQGHGTDAVTRVLIETSDGRPRGRPSAWGTTSSRRPGRRCSTRPAPPPHRELTGVSPRRSGGRGRPRRRRCGRR
jgi:2-isopropylmalate synthase